jgi:hypothetical protein
MGDTLKILQKRRKEKKRKEKKRKNKPFTALL